VFFCWWSAWLLVYLYTEIMFKSLLPRVVYPINALIECKHRVNTLVYPMTRVNDSNGRVNSSVGYGLLPLSGALKEHWLIL
jgi:hypothetical protein